MDYKTTAIIYTIVSFFIIGYSFLLWQKNKNYFDKLLLWTIAIAIQQFGVICAILVDIVPPVVSTVISSSLILLSIVLIIEAVNAIIEIKNSTAINYYILAASVVLFLVFFFIWESKLIRTIVFSSGLTALCFIEFKILLANKKEKEHKNITLVMYTLIIIGFTYLLRIAVYIWGNFSRYDIVSYYEIFSITVNLIGNLLVVLAIVTIINSTYMYKLEQLREKASKLSETDELTGLANRRYFNKKMKKEIERSDRYHNRLSIILLDIDNFKNINDTYGHDVGDEILIQIGNTLLHNSRSSDIIARWGGDEFIILLLESGKKESLKTAEKLKRAINNIKLTRNIHISLSIGISERILGENYASWFKKADNAIYKAKTLGKNQIFFCDEVDNLKEQLENLKLEKEHFSGIKTIDNDHQHMIKMLADMYKTKIDQAEMLSKGKALIAYTKKHSDSEENEMRKYEYPDFKKHHKAHEMLFENATRVFDDISNETAEFSSAAIAYVLKELIIEHFNTLDMSFFDYYKSLDLS